MNQFISLEQIRFQKSQSEFLFSPQHTFICSEHRHHHGSSQYLRIESYSGTRMLFFSWRVDWRQVMTSLKSVRDGYDDMVAIETVMLPALKCSRIIEWNIAILTHVSSATNKQLKEIRKPMWSYRIGVKLLSFAPGWKGETINRRQWLIIIIMNLIHITITQTSIFCYIE